MKKKTKSDQVDYEALGSTYQVVEIALLNQVLKAHGISDKGKRQKICEDFFFDQGVIIDQGAFQTEPGGKWYIPAPCFAGAKGSPDEGFARTKKFYKMSDDLFSYHEYAHASVEEFFVDCKEKTPFDWGPEHD